MTLWEGLTILKGDSDGTPTWLLFRTFIMTLSLLRMMRKSCILRRPGRSEYFNASIDLQSPMSAPSAIVVAPKRWQMFCSSSMLNTSALLYALAVRANKRSGANLVCPATRKQK